jgi:RNA polymerase sigma-70 factor (ECF subfamily)
VYGWPTGSRGNPQDAEDLTQETFVGLPLARRLLAGTFEGWLHRITTTSSRMVRRGSGSGSTPCRGHERLPGTGQPEQVYSDTTRPQVQAAPTRSPRVPRRRRPLRHRGTDYEEIAATLGIKLGTVRSRIHRGRVQLREALAHLAPRRPVAGQDAVAEGSAG